MIIGFTGTRNGMSSGQRVQFATVIGLRPAFKTLVHGDCIGADADAHVIARSAGLRVEIRPCDFMNSRAYCQGSDGVHGVKGAFDRNRDIVDTCDLLIGCPPVEEWVDLKKGGTVYTIRYALKQDRHTIVIMPSGRTCEYNAPASAY